MIWEPYPFNTLQGARVVLVLAAPQGHAVKYVYLVHLYLCVWYIFLVFLSNLTIKTFSTIAY